MDSNIKTCQNKLLDDCLDEKVTKRINNPEMSASKFVQYIRGLDCRSIAESVYFESISDEILSDISSTCRRRFKSKDVVVFVDLTSDDKYDRGIVFTEEKIISWNDSGHKIHEIKYEDITNVDYDEEDVIITNKRETFRINLGEYAEEEMYPRYMYNFIMDILEYVDDNKEAVIPSVKRREYDSNTGQQNNVFLEALGRSAKKSNETRERLYKNWIIRKTEHVQALLEEGKTPLDAITEAIMIDEDFGDNLESDEKIKRYTRKQACSTIEGILDKCFDFVDKYNKE